MGSSQLAVILKLTKIMLDFLESDDEILLNH